MFKDFNLIFWKEESLRQAVMYKIQMLKDLLEEALWISYPF